MIYWFMYINIIQIQGECKCELKDVPSWKIDISYIMYISIKMQIYMSYIPCTYCILCTYQFEFKESASVNTKMFWAEKSKHVLKPINSNSNWIYIHTLTYLETCRSYYLVCGSQHLMKQIKPELEIRSYQNLTYLEIYSFS